MKTRIELLQGTAQLAGDGVLGAIDTVEGMHLAVVDTVARFVPFGGLVARATGFVYARVRDVAHVTRRTADGTLALLERHTPLGNTRDDGDPALLAWLSAINGAFGDRLEASANPLAIDMQLCHGGHALDPNSAELSRAIAAADGNLVVFVHGLGMSDLQWRNTDGIDFGNQLERNGDAHVLHLRYNSGRRISANGRDLSQLLQTLHEAHASSIRRIVLVGHSMGGLVCRGACEHAQRHGFNWSGALDQVICLGTPHLGAPLERFGDSLSALLAATPYTRSLADIAEARSAGVKDLRHGWASDLDRRGEDSKDSPTRLPFASRVRWRLVAATLGPRNAGVRSRWLGDGLVPVPSALGQHEDAALSLRLPASQRRVFTHMGHMELLTSPLVFAQLREWIAQRTR